MSIELHELTRINKKLFILIPFFLLLSSCLGLSMDISMKRDGSGRITMEYQIPALIQNLGKLDGNESFPTVPVGRDDFERSITRIDGVKIVSFSSAEKGQDLVINIVIDFDNTEALANIIGETASFSDSNLSLSLMDAEDLEDIDQFIIELIKPVSEGKKLAFSFTKDGSSSTLKITDNNGREISASNTAQIVSSGKKVSFSIDTMDIFDCRDGLELKIAW